MIGVLRDIDLAAWPRRLIVPVRDGAVALFLLTVVGATGCGDNAVGLPCRPGHYAASSDGKTKCPSAGRLAFRHSDSVAMPVEEVNDYYFLLRKPWAAHAILRLVSVANDVTSASLDSYRITSTYPPLVDAWRNGDVRTGDPLVDAVFLENGAVSVAVSESSDIIFGVRFAFYTNWRTLKPLVDAIPDTAFYEEEIPPDSLPAVCSNIFLVERTELTARLQYQYGWGDCFTGSYSLHRFEATVNADDTVTLLDLGGDPIPPEVFDYAETTPIPPEE